MKTSFIFIIILELLYGPLAYANYETTQCVSGVLDHEGGEMEANFEMYQKELDDQFRKCGKDRGPGVSFDENFMKYSPIILTVVGGLESFINYQIAKMAAKCTARSSIIMGGINLVSFTADVSAFGLFVKKYVDIMDMLDDKTDSDVLNRENNEGDLHEKDTEEEIDEETGLVIEGKNERRNISKDTGCAYINYLNSAVDLNDLEIKHAGLSLASTTLGMAGSLGAIIMASIEATTNSPTNICFASYTSQYEKPVEERFFWVRALNIFFGPSYAADNNSSDIAGENRTEVDALNAKRKGRLKSPNELKLEVNRAELSDLHNRVKLIKMKIRTAEVGELKALKFQLAELQLDIEMNRYELFELESKYTGPTLETERARIRAEIRAKGEEIIKELKGEFPEAKFEEYSRFDQFNDMENFDALLKIEDKKSVSEQGPNKPRAVKSTKKVQFSDGDDNDYRIFEKDGPAVVSPDSYLVEYEKAIIHRDLLEKDPSISAAANSDAPTIENANGQEITNQEAERLKRLRLRVKALEKRPEIQIYVEEMKKDSYRKDVGLKVKAAAIKELGEQVGKERQSGKFKVISGEQYNQIFSEYMTERNSLIGNVPSVETSGPGRLSDTQNQEEVERRLNAQGEEALAKFKQLRQERFDLVNNLDLNRANIIAIDAHRDKMKQNDEQLGAVSKELKKTRYEQALLLPKDEQAKKFRDLLQGDYNNLNDSRLGAIEGISRKEFNAAREANRYAEYYGGDAETVDKNLAEGKLNLSDVYNPEDGRVVQHIPAQTAVSSQGGDVYVSNADELDVQQTKTNSLIIELEKHAIGSPGRKKALLALLAHNPEAGYSKIDTPGSRMAFLMAENSEPTAELKKFFESEFGVSKLAFEMIESEKTPQSNVDTIMEYLRKDGLDEVLKKVVVKYYEKKSADKQPPIRRRGELSERSSNTQNQEEVERRLNAQGEEALAKFKKLRQERFDLVNAFDVFSARKEDVDAHTVKMKQNDKQLGEVSKELKKTRYEQALLLPEDKQAEKFRDLLRGDYTNLNASRLGNDPSNDFRAAREVDRYADYYRRDAEAVDKNLRDGKLNLSDLYNPEKEQVAKHIPAQTAVSSQGGDVYVSNADELDVQQTKTNSLIIELEKHAIGSPGRKKALLALLAHNPEAGYQKLKFGMGGRMSRMLVLMLENEVPSENLQKFYESDFALNKFAELIKQNPGNLEEIKQRLGPMAENILIKIKVKYTAKYPGVVIPEGLFVSPESSVGSQARTTRKDFPVTTDLTQADIEAQEKLIREYRSELLKLENSIDQEDLEKIKRLNESIFASEETIKIMRENLSQGETHVAEIGMSNSDIDNLISDLNKEKFADELIKKIAQIPDETLESGGHRLKGVVQSRLNDVLDKLAVSPENYNSREIKQIVDQVKRGINADVFDVNDSTFLERISKLKGHDKLQRAFVDIHTAKMQKELENSKTILVESIASKGRAKGDTIKAELEKINRIMENISAKDVERNPVLKKRINSILEALKPPLTGSGTEVDHENFRQLKEFLESPSINVLGELVERLKVVLPHDEIRNFLGFYPESKVFGIESDSNVRIRQFKNNILRFGYGDERNKEFNGLMSSEALDKNVLSDLNPFDSDGVRELAEGRMKVEIYDLEKTLRAPNPDMVVVKTKIDNSMKLLADLSTLEPEFAKKLQKQLKGRIQKVRFRHPVVGTQALGIYNTSEAKFPQMADALEKMIRTNMEGIKKGFKNGGYKQDGASENLKAIFQENLKRIQKLELYSPKVAAEMGEFMRKNINRAINNKIRNSSGEVERYSEIELAVRNVEEGYFDDKNKVKRAEADLRASKVNDSSLAGKFVKKVKSFTTQDVADGVGKAGLWTGGVGSAMGIAQVVMEYVLAVRQCKASGSSGTGGVSTGVGGKGKSIYTAQENDGEEGDEAACIKNAEEAFIMSFVISVAGVGLMVASIAGFNLEGAFATPATRIALNLAMVTILGILETSLIDSIKILERRLENLKDLKKEFTDRMVKKGESCENEEQASNLIQWKKLKNLVIKDAYARTIDKGQRFCVKKNGAMDPSCGCQKSGGCWKIPFNDVPPSLQKSKHFRDLAIITNGITHGKISMEKLPYKKVDTMRRGLFKMASKIKKKVERVRTNDPVIQREINLLRNKGDSFVKVFGRRLFSSKVLDQAGSFMKSISPAEGLKKYHAWKSGQSKNFVAPKMASFGRSSAGPLVVKPDTFRRIKRGEVSVAESGEVEEISAERVDIPDEYKMGGADLHKKNRDIFGILSARYLKIYY